MVNKDEYIVDNANINAELITLQRTARFHFLIIVNDLQTKNQKPLYPSTGSACHTRSTAHGFY